MSLSLSSCVRAWSRRCFIGSRASCLALGMSIAILSSGLVGCALGPGCQTGNCYDCDGTAGRPIPQGPLGGLREIKRQITCGGGGCGEVYVGEWISTPPDCTDPCCGDQFVGGAIPSRPFCWQPGSLLQSLRLSGRYTDGGCGGGCGGGECGCGSGHGGDYFDGGIVEGPMYSEGAVMSHGGAGGGCSSCASKAMPGSNYLSSGRSNSGGQYSQSRPRMVQHAGSSPNRGTSPYVNQTPQYVSSDGDRMARTPSHNGAGSIRSNDGRVIQTNSMNPSSAPIRR